VSFYKLWATRVNAGSIDSDQYVGKAGHLFYDTEDRIIRISDGVTVGGIPLNTTNVGAGSSHTISNEGILISSSVDDVDFVGDLVTAVESPSGQVTVNIDSSAIPETFISQTFETLSKNLKSFPYTISYNGTQIANLSYTTGGGTMIKALNYSGDLIANIVISGTYLSETYTKTLTYANTSITGASYSVV
jgi:hypothetical protein